MLAPSRLNAGLLINAEHVITRPQDCTFPAALVQIDDAACLARELRVAGEQPTPMAPRAQRVLAKPAPKRGAADLGNDAAPHRLLAQIGDRPTSQWQTAT